MLKPKKLANAATFISIIAQLVYIVLASAKPEWIYFYVSSMIPGYNLSSLESPRDIDLGVALWGVVLMGISVWILVYIVVRIYNRWESWPSKTVNNQ